MITKETQDAIRASKIPVGISACLLGEPVRYDGGHKAHSYIMDTLGQYFEFRGFCPELDIGLGVPRKTIRLVGTSMADVRCQEGDGASQDHTEALRDSARRQFHWQQQMCGYIVKKDSPSCGMERVRLWQGDMPQRTGVGLYTQAMMEKFPYLPVEEEGRLGDPVLRENFVQRVFVLNRWFRLLAAGLTVAGLINFHSRHKLIVMSHSQQASRELGQFVAATGKNNLAQRSEQYMLQLMSVLKIKASRGNHVNVLQHVQGYLKNQLDAEDKQELVETIERYRQDQLPLIVPITLLNHHFRRHPDQYIAESWYMHPYPSELKLHNEI
ncbi:MAG: DUF523 and DUF1722 domain-containing protein [Gammaproteobacteria bacterium]